MKIRKEQDGNALTLILEGDLNTLTAPALEKELSEAVPVTEELILDMEKIEYISSAGLRVLITAHKDMDRHGCLKLIHVQPEVRAIFEITGLSGVFRIE